MRSRSRSKSRDFGKLQKSPRVAGFSLCALAIHANAAKSEVLTGLLYVAPDAEDLHAHLNTYAATFNTLGAKELYPASGMLEKINAALR